ncbi:MAG TPA: hypothetical protein DEP84_35430 [Chloroflexi bacterium]|nr:hypothetical protein [Chloroflexota bacterium]
MATVEGQQVQRRFDAGWWFKQGVIGGLIAGIVFAVFEMVVAALLNGVNAFFMPLRMIGGIVLGSQALQPAYPLVSAAVTGIVVHMILSMVFGVIFAVIVAYIPQLASTPAWLLVSASVFGLLLWLVNFYLIAPAAGWVWFPTNANPVVQFFAHTFFYGTVLGLYLNQVEDRQPEG